MSKEEVIPAAVSSWIHFDHSDITLVLTGSTFIINTSPSGCCSHFTALSVKSHSYLTLCSDPITLRTVRSLFILGQTFAYDP